MAADGSVIIDTRMDTSGVQNGVSAIKKSFNGLGSAVKKIGLLIGGAFAVGKLVQFGKECVELGSDLAEVQNVVDVTFTTMSDKVNEFAKNAMTTAGLSETMAKRYVGTFGAMSKSFGFSEAQAYDMSTALTQLTGDVASFYNISQDLAYIKLKSVFTGETETLKDLGVVLTQSALDQYALANGYGKTTSEMTEQEKVALRLAFVQKQLSAASGDFIRTSDSWANQVRVMQLQLQSLKATVGQGLINIFTPVIKVINTLLAKLATVANAFKSFTELITGNKSSGQTGASGAGLTGTDLSATEDAYGSAADGADSLADATQNVTDSTNDSTSALNKQTKALKKNIAPFDELKVIGKEAADAISGATKTPAVKADNIGLGNVGQVDYGGLAKGESQIDKLSKSAKKLSDILKQLWKPFQEAWNREGKNTIDAARYMFSSLAELAKSVGKSIMEVWTNGTGTEMLSTMLRILQNIFKIIGNIASQLSKAWNKNNVGTQIIQNLANAFQKVLEFIEKITKATADWAGKLDFYPLLDSIKNLTKSFAPIIEALGNVLEWIYTNIILPSLKWLIETGVPTLINIVSGFLNFLGEHQTLVEAFGAALIGMFATAKIIPLITTIISSISNVGLAIKGLIALMTGSGGILGGISAIATAIGPGGLIIAAIGGIIAAGVLLVKNWDSIKEFFGNIVDWISEKTRAFAEGFVNKWNSLTEKVSNIVIILSDSIKEKVVFIVSKFKSLINWVKTDFVNGWREAWNNVKNIFKNVFEALVGIAKVPINGVIGLINGMIRGIIAGVNAAIGVLNKMKIKVPGWVPGIGGNTWGFSIPTMTAPQIPYLAKGTVVPRNAGEFAAILGDNKRETEVVSPLSTMKQAMMDALKESGNNGGSSPQYIVLNIDGNEFIRWLRDQNGQYRNRTGFGIFEG
nr:MAG TPA: minor tail protein [Bacteriophage sp.]